MVLAQQVLFLLVSIFAIGLFARKMSSLRRTIFLGKKEPINDRKSARWKQVVLLALGQKKLFKKPIPAIFHFFVYAGFILINIEVLEILVDGICGTERAFAPYLGSLYPLAINFFEILAVLVLLGVIAFWLRRNVMRLKRFTYRNRAHEHVAFNECCRSACPFFSEPTFERLIYGLVGK